ncbi:spore germination protein [Effusibacillus lacus]|uniref:Spore germination protein n=1 Tax=Effusibacillus lacus TaxID=1348429 RepID=A0A292YSN8_9BACL|nr:spore germination protein [Effusibacillus lacus]TCS73567.1 spore germination protein KA [Effusibacillus lacus]GAX91939.1 spore germination protein [Effusibacillus lacus]
MSVWSKFKRLLTVDDSIMDEEFSLLPPGEEDDEDTPVESEHPAKIRTKKPRKLEDLKKDHGQQNKQNGEESGKRDSGNKESGTKDSRPEHVLRSLEENKKLVEQFFCLPKNKDVVIREFIVNSQPVINAFAVFMEGISDKKTINTHVLEPLMLLAGISREKKGDDPLQRVKERLLPGNQIVERDKWKDVLAGILGGSTAVFIENEDKVLIVETKGWEQRGVGETKTETVVRGPHDAFTENLRANTGLVRARLRTEKLITEMMQVGELAPTDVAVMYLEGIVNPKLVQEVKRRIKAIKVDFLQDSGTLEQFIEDPPNALIPKMMATERPDRVAASLSEGFVAVFVGQSPYVLILPTVIWSLLHTAEDAFLRFPFGSFIRIIRFASFLMALLLPAFYIAVTNFHPEMIPTDLMLAIAAARERVPFPVVLEVLLMELSLELIREAGIRIPNVIGPTIGIVGALILGQAAVQAGIISPLLVIVVAVTALAAFTLPNYNFSFAIRTLRFLFIFIAAVWGFYGITLGIMVVIMHWATMKSFGVPMLSPVAPFKPSSPDIILRGPVYMQEKRPRSLRPQDTKRQHHFTRPWDPTTHDSQEAQAQRQNKTVGSQSDRGGEQLD